MGLGTTQTNIVLGAQGRFVRIMFVSNGCVVGRVDQLNNELKNLGLGLQQQQENLVGMRILFAQLGRAQLGRAQ